MPLCNAMFAHILPGDAILRSRKIRNNLQPLATDIRILSVVESLDCSFKGGGEALRTAKGVSWSRKKPLKRIQTVVGIMENSRLETKFPCTRAVTLIIRRYMIKYFSQNNSPQNSLVLGWLTEQSLLDLSGNVQISASLVNYVRLTPDRAHCPDC